MSTLITVANGNLTASTVWGLIDPTSLNAFFQNSSNAQLTTSSQQSNAFTPGAITVIGLVVHLASRAASPSGTLSIGLYQAGTLVSGTQVTVNISDLESLQTSASANLLGIGLYYFQFAAPVTLTASTAYTLGMLTSVSSQVSGISSGGSNWERGLVTSTTQAPVAGDNLLVMGGWTGAGTPTSSITITMNSTAATAYGYLSVGNNGSLLYGTAASTNYVLRLTGNLYILTNGIFRIGSQGTPIPSTSTAVLEFVLTSNYQYGVYVSNHGIYETCGVGPTSCWTTLTANATAGATAITVGSTAGWNNGDTIVLSATDGTTSHYEIKTLSGITDGTDATISSGLTYARSGTTPNVSYIANMTRNVKVRSTNSSYATFQMVYAGAWISWRNTEFYYFGGGGNPPWLYYCAGPATMSYVDSCSIHPDIDTYATSSFSTANDSITTPGNLTFNNNVMAMVSHNYNGGILCSVPSNTISFTNNFLIACYGGFQIQSTIFTYTGNVAANINADCFAVSTSTQITSGTLSGNVASNGGGAGFSFGGNGITGGYNYTWSNNTSIHCYYGITYGSGTIYGENHTIQNFNLYGDQQSEINLPYPIYRPIVFKNINAPGISGVTTGYFLSPSSGYYECVVVDSCTAGTVGTLTNFINAAYTANIVAINNTVTDTNDSTWWGGTYYEYHTPHVGYILFYKHNGSSSWKLQRGGAMITPDTTIYSSASPSIRIAPETSGKSWGPSATFAVNGTATISVKVRCSVAGDGAAYNGNLPRLMLRANPIAGNDLESVLATATSASNGAWQTLTATVSPTGKQLMEVYVDCDGTTGWVNVDSFGVTGTADPTECDFWPQPFTIGTFGAGGGSTTYYAF